jgi:dTDP-4-dehydrorhamnose reductase
VSQTRCTALLTGANGQLGQDLQAALAARGDDCIPLSHSDLDVCDAQAVERALDEHQPGVVINTAAYHKVDEVESNPERAFAVNATAPVNLARACKARTIALAHVSTDYVFGGDRTTAYTEDSLPSPLNVYGVSKLAGEYLVRSTLPEHYVVRTSGLYGVAGSSGKGGNFIELMLRLARERGTVRVVTDQVLAPTYTHDLASKIVDLIHSGRYGLYHVVNAGQCSWFEFAAAIFELANVQVDLQPTTTAEFGAPARRPSFSVLARRRLAEEGLDDMPAWRDALGRYLAARASP